MTPADGDGLVDAARHLGPVIAERAGEVEQLRHVPDDLVAELARPGFFRMWLPAELGGLEVPPSMFVRVIEALAMGDASTAWTVMIGASSAPLAAILDERAAREVFADPTTIVGGALAPKGTARAVDGGWVVSGQWPFISGGRNCAWLTAGCVVVDDDGRPLRSDVGGPVFRNVVLPAADVTFLDTWHVAGLCGTGSNDMVVDGVTVPDRFTFTAGPTHPWTAGGLFHIPLYALLGIALSGVPLGIARAALDDLTALATTKRPVGGAGQRLADSPMVAERLARAEAGLGAARCYLLEALDRLTAEAGAGKPSVRTRTVVRTAVNHAVDASVAAVDAAYTLAGGTSLYTTSPLQRRFRDVHAATQHVLLSPPLWPAAGRALLGLDPNPGLF